MLDRFASLIPPAKSPATPEMASRFIDFDNGKVSPEQFIKIAPQKIAAGKKVAYGVRKTAAGTAIPYPAGLAVISRLRNARQLLVANNLSDNVVLLDSAMAAFCSSSISAPIR